MPARTETLPDTDSSMEPPSDAAASPERAQKHRKNKKEKKKKHSDKHQSPKEQCSQLKENGKLEDGEETGEDSNLLPPKAKKHKTRGDARGEVSLKKSKGEKNGTGTNATVTKEIKVETIPLSSESSCDSEVEQEPSEASEELTQEQREGAFSNFKISQETIELLKGRGVTYLFPIQVQTFNFVYNGQDCVAQARTGTGKTFSFAIPLVEKLQSSQLERKRGRAPQVLVLTPTRELAIQVARDFKDVTKRLSVACFYGGTDYKPQIFSIRSGIDILVGTPGRIRDHLQNQKVDLSQVKHVVLDEVDQMLDMGFADQVEDILGVAYKKDSQENPQTLLFSATCPPWVYSVGKKYMKGKFEQIDLIGKRTQKAATTVEHLAIECHWSQRAAVIGDVIQVYSGIQGRTIIFSETKREVSELAVNPYIKQDTQCLHGDIPQKQREITLKGFRDGTFGVLVATNVAARGLDIPEVDLVIQCSPPKDVDSYIHRSGRTGRAGRTGVCICFYQRREEEQLRYVEQKAGLTFKRVGVPTTNDIIKASSKDALKCLESVTPAAIELFNTIAEKLIAERGAVEALAAALAHISGASSIEQRSLLTSDAGFITLVMSCSVEMHNISLAWKELREQFGSVDDKVKRMRFLKDKMGVCFDVAVASLKELQEQWKDSRRWQLSVATELPELEESQRDGDFRNHSFNGRGGFNRRGGGFNRRGRGGGGGGGFNRGRNGRGTKRSFDRAFDR
uniref:RNA helicase n=1 Tax=Callorhinchus milii TaxID=7868 RepID=V9KG53_CALMI|eukprot:gi/632972584/ref/XP_007902730.1/ PREDICTED: nucleolar RNA helicase 2-like [Callorhinchus milii]